MPGWRFLYPTAPLAHTWREKTFLIAFFWWELCLVLFCWNSMLLNIEAESKIISKCLRYCNIRLVKGSPIPALALETWSLFVTLEKVRFPLFSFRLSPLGAVNFGLHFTANCLSLAFSKQFPFHDKAANFWANFRYIIEKTVPFHYPPRERHHRRRTISSVTKTTPPLRLASILHTRWPWLDCP